MNSDFRLLVVEDDTLIQDMLKTCLSPAFEVEGVSTMRACLERVGRQPHLDGLILDLVLPNGGGLALVRDLHESKPDVPLIVLTGHAFRREDVLGAGASEYLQKPSGVDQVREAVERHVYLKRAIDWTRPLKRLVDEARAVVEEHLAKNP